MLWYLNLNSVIACLSGMQEVQDSIVGPGKYISPIGQREEKSCFLFRLLAIQYNTYVNSETASANISYGFLEE